MIKATVLTDSIGVDAPRLLTYELIYPRFIHADFMTHRVLSRNASSSRAIPVLRMLEAIRQNPAKPVEWRMDEPGMQGFTVATPEQALVADRIWELAMEDAIRHALSLQAGGYHKQHINRITEPYQHIRVVVTGTEWMNFEGLRNHPDADPTIQALAAAMIAAREASTPKLLQLGDWHLPYILPEDHAATADFYQRMSIIDADRFGIASPLDLLKRISAARCARVSYKTHDGNKTDIIKDIKLANKLVGSAPIHASPVEHQAAPDAYLTKGRRWMSPEKHGNLRGWNQFRKFIANETLDTPLPIAA